MQKRNLLRKTDELLTADNCEEKGVVEETFKITLKKSFKQFDMKKPVCVSSTCKSCLVFSRASPMNAVTCLAAVQHCKARKNIANKVYLFEGGEMQL